MTRLYTTLAITLLSLNLAGQTISGTEAVEYDPTGNRFLITNGNSILQQASGSSELEYFGESDADYGMEVIDNILYTISGAGLQSVKFHDLTTEEELNSITIPGSGFLNGMGSDPTNNRIWITDFGNNDIYEIDVTDTENPIVTTVVDNTGCTPNGITYDEENNRLAFTCWSGGNIRSVDLTDYSVSTLTNTGLNSIDGIDHDEDGNFYISSWQPTRISKLSDDFEVLETVTAPGISQPADISYAVQIDTLAVANSGNSSITYIHFGETSGILEFDASTSLEAYPNPISESSLISFHLTQKTNCHLAIYDIQGKLVHELLNEDMPSGDHKVALSRIQLENGSYICKLHTKLGTRTINLIKE